MGHKFKYPSVAYAFGLLHTYKLFLMSTHNNAKRIKYERKMNIKII